MLLQLLVLRVVVLLFFVGHALREEGVGRWACWPRT